MFRGADYNFFLLGFPEDEANKLKFQIEVEGGLTSINPTRTEIRECTARPIFIAPDNYLNKKYKKCHKQSWLESCLKEKRIISAQENDIVPCVRHGEKRRAYSHEANELAYMQASFGLDTTLSDECCEELSASADKNYQSSKANEKETPADITEMKPDDSDDVKPDVTNVANASTRQLSNVQRKQLAMTRVASKFKGRKSGNITPKDVSTVLKWMIANHKINLVLNDTAYPDMLNEIRKQHQDLSLFTAHGISKHMRTKMAQRIFTKNDVRYDLTEEQLQVVRKAIKKHQKHRTGKTTSDEVGNAIDI